MEEEQLRFMVDSELRAKLDEVFRVQGINMKEGMGRLVAFLVGSPAEMHPLILGQLPGMSARAVTKTILAIIDAESETPRSTGRTAGRAAASRGVPKLEKD